MKMKSIKKFIEFNESSNRRKINKMYFNEWFDRYSNFVLDMYWDTLCSNNPVESTKEEVLYDAYKDYLEENKPSDKLSYTDWSDLNGDEIIDYTIDVDDEDDRDLVEILLDCYCDYLNLNENIIHEKFV